MTSEFLPYARQSINQQDLDYVKSTLLSPSLTQGPTVQRFEELISHYANVNYAVAVNSATSGLHLACIALGVSSGDIVWTSPISFVASSNCALYCGASVDFVDIDINSGLMCPIHLKEKLVHAKKIDKLPKVVIPVHLAGSSCDMVEISRLSKEFGFAIIEDASHAIGGIYNNNTIGSCAYSDITIFSFHPVKIITTGEGGLVLTNKKTLFETIQLLRGHGITRDNFFNDSPGNWYYEMQELGFNYRMSDIHASLGISQLSRLDEFVSKRNRIVSEYYKLLSSFDYLKLYIADKSCYSSYHLAIVNFKMITPSQHRKLFDEMRSKGIYVQLHYWPIHLQYYYKQLGFTSGLYPSAERYGKSSFSIPLFYDMELSQCQRVVTTMIDLYNSIIKY